eukprot:IDg2660t1
MPSRSASLASTTSVPQLALIALSPMGKISHDDKSSPDNEEEATRFNAESQHYFFKEVFQLYGQRFDDWCVCLVGDNCSTNQRISSISGKLLIGCCSHKLNLEVNKMVSEHKELGSTIKTIHETMVGARKLKMLLSAQSNQSRSRCPQ